MTQNTFRPGTTINLDMYQAQYSARYPVIVIKEFDFKQELDAFVGVNKALDPQYSYEPQGFMNHLIEKGFIVEVSYDSVHLGDYNDPDIYTHKFK